MELDAIESAIIEVEQSLHVKRSFNSELSFKKETLTTDLGHIRNKYSKLIYDIKKKLEEEIRLLEGESLVKSSDTEEELRETKNTLWDSTLELRRMEQHLSDLERQRDIARRQHLKVAEFATLENRWDLMTANLPWRKFALPHQLSAAKKMTYEGRMILGDSMGLGKTMASLIAIDMIEAATKEASLDNPIKFGSMD